MSLKDNLKNIGENTRNIIAAIAEEDYSHIKLPSNNGKDNLNPENDETSRGTEDDGRTQ